MAEQALPPKRRKVNVGIRLYEARDTTGDVTIKAKIGSYKVHLCVLSTWSQVFAAMFSTDMTEGHNKVIKMEHFDDAVVKDFIDFIYLDNLECHDLQGDPSELLKLAHMYVLEDLVSACWCCLMGSLSAETVLDLLLLSEKYGNQEQKDRVAKFFKKHHEAVMKTTSYVTLIKEHSDLYLKICGAPSVEEREYGYGGTGTERKFTWRQKKEEISVNIVYCEIKLRLVVSLSDTVESLKAEIQSKLQVYSVSSIRSIWSTYDGLNIDICKIKGTPTLSDCKIRNNGTLYVIM